MGFRTVWRGDWTLIQHEVPSYGKDGFNCPYCGAFSQQYWRTVKTSEHVFVANTTVNGLSLAYCAKCRQYSIWREEQMVYPIVSSALLPHSDLPDEIRNDYEEARAIVSQSPRGAAALLRLAIQKLCSCLGEEGKNINKDIGNLVEKGLPRTIQMALDVVRVIGNNAVHPGQIDLEDDTEIVGKLFKLVNMIVEETITRSRELDELYDSLPEGSREAIARRDGQEQ